MFQIPVHHIAVEGHCSKKNRGSKLSTQKLTTYGYPNFQLEKNVCSISKDNLHLKSNVTLLKPGTIVYSDDKAGQGVMKQIQEKSTKSYDFVAVPDEKGWIFDLV